MIVYLQREEIFWKHLIDWKLQNLVQNSLITSKIIGECIRIDDNQIEELNKKFSLS